MQLFSTPALKAPCGFKLLLKMVRADKGPDPSGSIRKGMDPCRERYVGMQTGKGAQPS